MLAVVKLHRIGHILNFAGNHYHHIIELPIIPPYKGQVAHSQFVLYSEVPLYMYMEVSPLSLARSSKAASIACRLL